MRDRRTRLGLASLRSPSNLSAAQVAPKYVLQNLAHLAPRRPRRAGLQGCERHSKHVNFRPLQYHDGAQDFSSLHLVERILYLIDADRLRDKAVQIQLALKIQVDQDREVAAGEAVTVP